MEKSKIREFIDANGLSFDEGSRNTICTTIIGFALHLGLGQNDLEVELSDEIEADGFIQDEIDRLFPFCSNRGYGNWWKKKEAKKAYKF